MSDIGLLNEKPLHSSLKKWYLRPGDLVEVRVDKYIIDIVRDDVLIEIQTCSFPSIKSKVIDLVKSHKLRLVYPIAMEKWIIKLDQKTGGESQRRRSPRKGRITDIFGEMVSFPQLMTDSNFSIEVLLIREEEIRRFDEKRNWRRKGWGIEERRLLEVLDRKLFERPEDWQDLIPEDIGESFTAKELAKTTGIEKPLAQKMAYCLRKAGVINLIDKKGHAHLYMIGGN